MAACVTLPLLLVREETAPSTVGIVIAALPLLVMPGPVVGARLTGRELASPTVVADSTQALLCA